MEVVRVHCPRCQHVWQQKVDETKQVETDCNCPTVMDMEIIEATWGGTWCNVLITFKHTFELGGFSKDKIKISKPDLEFA